MEFSCYTPSLFRHVRDNVYLQRKLFRKKVSALATDDSAMPADQYFLQQCVQYLERLASIDEKGAAKFIKRACKEQGRALVWVLQMASRSSFVASLVIQQLGQVTELDFKSQPQLFLEDNNETSTLTKVFSSLINMKVMQLIRLTFALSLIRHLSLLGCNNQINVTSYHRNSV